MTAVPHHRFGGFVPPEGQRAPAARCLLGRFPPAGFASGQLRLRPTQPSPPGRRRSFLKATDMTAQVRLVSKDDAPAHGRRKRAAAIGLGPAGGAAWKSGSASPMVAAIKDLKTEMKSNGCNVAGLMIT